MRASRLSVNKVLYTRKVPSVLFFYFPCNYKGIVKGEGFSGPGNIEVHYNSIGFVKGKGKRKILQSTPGPGIHYNSIGFVKGRRVIIKDL